MSQSGRLQSPRDSVFGRASPDLAIPPKVPAGFAMIHICPPLSSRFVLLSFALPLVSSQLADSLHITSCRRHLRNNTLAPEVLSTEYVSNAVPCEK